jgi:hypothetical protein
MWGADASDRHSCVAQGDATPHLAGPCNSSTERVLIMCMWSSQDRRQRALLCCVGPLATLESVSGTPKHAQVPPGCRDSAMEQC